MSREENRGCRRINPGETIAQLGGRSINGALAYTGTWRVEHGDLWLRLHVNSKPHKWHFNITVNGADLYDVELWSVGESKELIDERSDLFFEDLQHAVESLYDEAIDKYNDGAIFIS